MAAALLIAQGKQRCRLLLRMANRHGLIAGATGTGKTVTLRVIAGRKEEGENQPQKVRRAQRMTRVG